jgi:raffinose/stachyose/melibiose transport system substrate-binding protein
MKQRVVARVVCLLVALALVPALGFATGGAETKSTEKIVMRMGDNLTDRSGTWGAVVEQINAEFIKAHPNVSFETESYPDQPYQEKIKLYATSGQLPDVFKYWSFSTLLKPLVDAKLVAELSASEFKAMNFIPGSLEVNMFDGKLYGVPTNSDFWVIYYNKRLFKEAGVEVPATIEELVASIPKFRAKGIVPMSTDGKDAWPLSITFDNLTERGNGDYSVIQKALDRTMKFTDAPFVAGARLLQDLGKSGLFQDDLLTSDYGASRNLFGQEKAAMYLMGSWEMGLPTDKNFPESFRQSLGVMKIPALKSGKGSADDLMAWFGGNYVVSAKSKHKDLGIAYLKFYFTRFPVIAWEKQVVFPAQKVATTDKDTDVAKGLVAVINSAKVTSGTPSLDRATAAFKEDHQKLVKDLVAGVLTPEAFTKALDDSAATAAGK